METKKQNYTLPIIVMIFLFGMISFVTNLASPMGDILKYQFNVPNWMGTLGVFANFIAYAIMGYPAGNMLQKYGYKKTALVAIAVGFTGVGIQTLSGSVESFGVYLLGAFIAGFSMCLLNTVVNPMLNKLGGGGNKGNQLIQAGGSFNSLCGTAVIILTGLLVLVGLCTSVMWGGIFNLAVEGLGKYTEKASGIFMALVCGGGILPLLQNGIVDLTGGVGYLTSYWVIVAGLAYMLYYALIGSKNVNKDIPVD